MSVVEKPIIVRVHGYGAGGKYPRLNIPVEVAEVVGIRPGDYVAVEVRDGELVIRPAPLRRAGKGGGVRCGLKYTTARKPT